MHSYEIEIKSLLGSEEAANALVSKMRAADTTLAVTDSYKQLNHYFEGGDVKNLYSAAEMYLTEADKSKFQKIAAEGKDISVRTREMNGTVILVLKASVDDTTSANGTARIECESTVPLSLDALDQLVLGAGFHYQAKWSRERTEYKLSGKDITVCLDKNAGYGYVAEFEKVIGDATHADAVKAELRGLMQEFGVEELPQDRLERMFAHYNQHWAEYYGTNNVFTIK